ncbi:universal stress protein [Devosia sp. 1566]|uniref:universal stress protein n=1 Tax=Devosia sp. 1566 TaxID=2499144 RepID=UPI000FDB2376|nr:universal stress protein [Devosia sp. 1566]
MKDIVVQLTGSPEDEFRLTTAETIARSFEAHLTGLLVHMRPEIFAGPEASLGLMLQEMINEAERLTRERQAALEDRLDKMGLPTELRVVSGFAGTVGSQMAAEARTADLFVGTRPYGEGAQDPQIEEAVLFESGTGCLWLPPMKAAASPLDMVLVAWKDTRESSRAVKDALPLLKLAGRVVVAMVTDEPGEASGVVEGGDIARYLSRHGVAVELREIAGWRNAAEAIQNEAEKLRAQLIVAGAYSHSRMRERLLGGVTRVLLSEAVIPVFMSR